MWANNEQALEFDYQDLPPKAARADVLRWGTPSRVCGIPCISYEGRLYDQGGYLAEWLEAKQ